MKIQLKRSNVLDGGLAKEPTAAQMEYGELAVNYSETDPVLFLKDSSDNIIRIAGAGAPGGGGGAGDGLTQIDNGDNTFNLAVQAYPGYGIAVETQGVRIGDDWSAIPTLV
jgi:hypothetical protein